MFYSSFVVSAGLVVTTSASVTVTDAILSVSQYGSIAVVSTNQTFNISAVIVDQITKIQIGNINFNSLMWTGSASLYTSIQYQSNGTLIAGSSSSIIVDLTTGVITATNLAITEAGMYIIKLLITSTNNQYSLPLISNGILVKAPTS